MGIKPNSKMAGTWVPTVEMVGPSPEVKVDAGAIQETPITVAPMRPICPRAKPLDECPDEPALGADSVVAALVGRKVLTTRPLFQFYKLSNSRSEEHTSELQSRGDLVCRLLL